MHQTSVSAVKYESRSLNSDTHQMFMKKQERKAQNGLKQTPSGREQRAPLLIKRMQHSTCQKAPFIIKDNST